jgi:hypothetical protein
MNRNFEELKTEIIQCKAEFDIASTCFIEALKTYYKRLERAEKWISDQEKAMLN